MPILRKYFLYISILLCIILVVFPEIDIAFSGIFYDSALGFKHKNNIMAVGIFKLVPKFAWVYLSILFLHIIYKAFMLRSAKDFIKLPAIFLMISAIIGPGFVVNYALKENWGRARPNVVQEFGGDKKFVRACVVSDQCVSNCSFSSGHAAMGYYFTSMAWLAPIYLQNIVFVATFLFGSFVGLGRIVQGSHFFSDIAFSFLIIMVTNYASYAFWNYLKRKYKTQDDKR